MPFCPNCGKEVGAVEKFCPNCGTQLVGKEETKTGPQVPTVSAKAVERVGAVEALTKGVNIIIAKPMVLVPALLGAIISAVLSSVASLYFGWGFWFAQSPVTVASLMIGGLLVLIGGIVGYILNFASLDMSRDAYLNQELNLSKSISYVLRRIGTFIVASIVGAILAITVILIPVAVLMFVIIILDETGIGNAMSGAFKVLGARLVDVIILLIISIVADVILGFVPFIGSILVAAFNVAIALAFIHIYLDYKKTGT